MKWVPISKESEPEPKAKEKPKAASDAEKPTAEMTETTGKGKKAKAKDKEPKEGKSKEVPSKGSEKGARDRGIESKTAAWEAEDGWGWSGWADASWNAADWQGWEAPEVRKGGKGRAREAASKSEKGRREDVADDEDEEEVKPSRKGSKGKEKGDTKGKGKSKGKGKGKDKNGLDASKGVKTLQEIEAELAENQALKREKRSAEGYGKQPLEFKGSHCQVHKHSGMGCAVVSMHSAQAREAVMRYVERKNAGKGSGLIKIEIQDVVAQLRRHTDKSTQREVVTDIFVAWGHRAEKEAQLPVDEIADAFDNLYEEAQKMPEGQTAAGAASAQLSSALGAIPMAGGLRPPPPPSGPPQVVSAQAQQAQAAYMAEYAQRTAMYYSLAGHPGMVGFPQPRPQMMHPAILQQQQAMAMLAQQQQMHQLQQLQQQQLLMHRQQMQQMAREEGSSSRGQASSTEKETRRQKAAPVPATPPRPTAPTDSASPEGASQLDYAPAKPRLLPIVDPASGKPIDTIGMNFEPRKPSSPLQIIDPTSGEAVIPAKP